MMARTIARALGVGRHGLDERLIDLQLVDGQVLQRCQRRVARAEVVDRYAYAQRAQLLAGSHRRGRVRHQAAFGDFQHQRVRRDIPASQRLGHRFGQLRIVQRPP